MNRGTRIVLHILIADQQQQRALYLFSTLRPANKLQKTLIRGMQFCIATINWFLTEELTMFPFAAIQSINLFNLLAEGKMPAIKQRRKKALSLGKQRRSGTHHDHPAQPFRQKQREN